MESVSSRLFSSFYECQCPHLNRQLPFRAAFEQAVLADIVARYPLSQNLVYVSQGPGGCLSDVSIIAQLLARGYTKLDLVFIEPLYETHADVLNACLALQEWCRTLSYEKNCIITPYFYTTLRAYAHDCERNLERRGTIFITMDPDDTHTLPRFSSFAFRKKLSRFFKTSMQSDSMLYYLYFQPDGHQNYRHMLMGHYSMLDHKPFLRLKHAYGIESFEENIRTYLFLNNDHVYPFNREQDMVQIKDRVVRDAVLWQLCISI